MITLSPPEAPETVSIWVTKEQYPIFWENKVKCLEESCDSREEAEEMARQFFSEPLEIELIYETGLGYFGIESEALDGGATCVSPFSKEEIVCPE